MSHDNLSLIEALAHIEILNRQLAEMKQDLSKWKLMFSFESIPGELGVKVKALKPYNGGGAIRTLTPSDIAYFVSDKESLIRDVAHQFYDALLKDQIFDDLAPGMRRVITNVSKISGR